MQFNIKTGVEEKVGSFTRVQVISIETNSNNPRTNKRKLRAFFRDYLGVKPQFIKYAMKAQGFWDKDRLGPNLDEQVHTLTRGG